MKNLTCKVFALTFGVCLQFLTSFPSLKASFICLDIPMVLFTLLCGASKDFMKALKAFKKPFEAPQGSVKTWSYCQD